MSVMIAYVRVKIWTQYFQKDDDYEPFKIYRMSVWQVYYTLDIFKGTIQFIPRKSESFKYLLKCEIMERIWVDCLAV
jgi:hypothetical protein